MRIEILDAQGAVINTIIADEQFAEQHHPGAWRIASVQTDLQQAALVSPSCTPAQGLVALYVLHGITEQDIAAAIAAIPDSEQRYTAQVAFSRATEWRRDSSTMQIMAGLLGLDGAALDALFAKAVTVLV